MDPKKTEDVALDMLSGREKTEIILDLRGRVILLCVVCIVMMFTGLAACGLLVMVGYKLQHVNDRYADIILEGSDCNAGNLTFSEVTLRFNGLTMDTAKYMQSQIPDSFPCSNVSVRMFVYGYSP